MNKGRDADVLVVGAGATGSWVAHLLATAGRRVLVLEAGGSYAPTDERDVRGVPPSAVLPRATYPFVVPPGREFDWLRVRAVGGRLNAWMGVCLRLSDHEFRAHDRDGRGTNWPITHRDLATHYAEAERALQVAGAPEGVPHLPDGDYVPAWPLSPAASVVKSIVERRWTDRRILRPRISLANDVTPLLRQAQDSGRVELKTHQAVSRILPSTGGGRARAVVARDTRTGTEEEIGAGNIVLAASTIESVRLLLNSPGMPVSHHLGTNVMDHTTAAFSAAIDPTSALAQARCPPGHVDLFLLGCFGHVIPESRFTRAWGLQCYLHCDEEGRPVLLRGFGFGEVLARRENAVRLCAHTRDALGVPAAEIDVSYSDDDLALFTVMVEAIRELLDVVGASDYWLTETPMPPGFSVHEVGGARMGSEPDASVVDPHGRLWGASNLYVADGSVFVSSGCQNPTLTMMACAGRAAAHLASRPE